jgi:murein DD-endopeptidase MepM/ murein hydrolase activator NlpD
LTHPTAGRRIGELRIQRAVPKRQVETMAAARTFKLTSPHMRGDDVRAWQRILNKQFDNWGVKFHAPVDGDYGVPTRDATATVLHGLGILLVEMQNGITPELRTKVRDKKLSPTERTRRVMRRLWRRRLREKHAGGGVARPVAKIISSSWGWHVNLHDGVDLICPPDAAIYALCDAEVFDVRASGWWGLGAQPAAGHALSEGDGIIQLRCLADIGPFRRGMHFGYGHAEHARVRVGQRVEAGQRIGSAGFANAWHVHFMVNGGSTKRGIGDRDPMPFVKYAIKHG